MTNVSEVKARHIINQKSISELIELWVETENQVISIHLADVRGWIMDALDAKNPTAFEKWILSDSNNPRGYFND